MTTTLENPTSQTTTSETRAFFADYMQELSGKPKTPELIDRFTTDTALKQHILQTESAFPNYVLTAHATIVENDMVAIRATMTAVHKGTFAGIEATGKSVSIDVMVFYRITDGKISKFWMELDMHRALEQLTN